MTIWNSKSYLVHWWHSLINRVGHFLGNFSWRHSLLFISRGNNQGIVGDRDVGLGRNKGNGVKILWLDQLANGFLQNRIRNSGGKFALIAFEKMVDLFSRWLNRIDTFKWKHFNKLLKSINFFFFKFLQKRKSCMRSSQKKEGKEHLPQLHFRLEASHSLQIRVEPEWIAHWATALCAHSLVGYVQLAFRVPHAFVVSFAAFQTENKR